MNNTVDSENRKRNLPTATDIRVLARLHYQASYSRPDLATAYRLVELTGTNNSNPQDSNEESVHVGHQQPHCKTK